MSKNKHTKAPKGKNKPSKRTSDNPARSLAREDLQRLARHVFEANPGEVLSYKQVCYAFGKTTMAQKRTIYQTLVDMASAGELTELEPGRFVYGARGQERMEGRFDYRGGRASFIPDPAPEGTEAAEGNDAPTGSPSADSVPESLPLDERALGTALHGDRVAVTYRRNKRGEYKHLRIAEILERRPSTYVGTLETSRGYSFFVTNNRELRQDLYIPEDKTMNAGPRDKVVVRVTGWDAGSKNPRGEVIDLLGKSGDNNTEMHAILAEYGLPYSYPTEVEEAAEKLSGEITEEALREREDFRGIFTCTIDPADAKDFDDALSWRQLPEGGYEVGVHIADVSHFVTPDSIIDREAYKRATSIYLVDRTIPMLPERLSNGLCSLRPDEDKYAYSCIFTLTEDAQIRSARIARTIIRSQRRYTYEEAQAIIDTHEGDYAEVILSLHQLAQLLRQRRFAAGSIAFDRPEVRFDLDEAGRPVGIHVKESKPAHQLIEEFMLLANRTVAERITEPERKDITPALSLTRGRKPTFVYRIHEAPEAEKLRTLGEFVRRLGYKLQTEGDAQAVAQSINALLKAIQGQPEEDMITMLTIRSMAKARYTTAALGHYGLGFASYTHFTSPIRRYPDLMVHRLLTRYLIDHKPSADAAATEEQCDHSSEMETLAATAERASIKYKQVEYMLPRLGQEFEGVITGLADWGIYVELEENKCEGLVPARDLTDDYYEYDEQNFRLVGRHTGNTYRLGDKLQIVVASANLERKQLDFALVGSEPRSRQRPARATEGQGRSARSHGQRRGREHYKGGKKAHRKGRH